MTVPACAGTVSAVPSQLCVLGDFAWDVLIRTNTELLRGGDTFGEVMLTPGGSAANVVVWAARCGQQTHFIGKIGRDTFGQLAQDDLRNEGVTGHLVETDAHLTGSVAVFVDHTGERSMVSGRGADFYLLPSEPPLATRCARIVAPAPHRLVVLRSAAVGGEAAAHLARDEGATLSFDPGSFQMIQEMGVEHFLDHTQDLGIDILLPNYEEAQTLTGLD